MGRTPEEIERGGSTPDELDPLPDQPLGSNDRTTAAEQHDGEALGDRLAREEPERPARGERTGVPGGLEDQGAVDEEKDQVADIGEGPEDSNLSAEEAAVRVQDETRAPGLTDGPDRYVED